MKKVFRKIQKGTTKMIERIKSLGEMETKQKCVVQRFEIIIPLHQKITTQYIASASFTCVPGTERSGRWRDGRILG